MVAPSLTRRLLDAHAHLVLSPADSATPSDPRLRVLSEREYEVLVAVGKGWTNTEIGARDRIQAVILAYDAGLVRPQGQPRPVGGGRSWTQVTSDIDLPTSARVAGLP